MSNKKLPVWDLSEYYKGIDDPKIEKDIKKYFINCLCQILSQNLKMSISAKCR